MEKIPINLEPLIEKGKSFLLSTKESELTHKPSADKWSKKEILGHLIDSAINNLQRFTEVLITTQPYQLRTYMQNELVIVNDYQNGNLQEMVNLWRALNTQILRVIYNYSQENLKLKMIIDNGDVVDLKYWIEDYTQHTAHHLKQIMSD